MNLKKVILRLNYIKFSISKVVSIEQSDLINRIASQLSNQDYNIISSSDNQITFSGHGNKFKPLSKSKYSKKLDIGIFELRRIEEGELIKLSYFVSILSEIALLTFLIIIALFTDYWAFIFTIILFIRIWIKTSKLRYVGKKLVFDITAR